jgi:hypothetical protein
MMSRFSPVENDEDGAGASSAGEEEEKERPTKKKKMGLDADDVFASIPKTDKQLHEKRLKSIERDARREARNGVCEISKRQDHIIAVTTSDSIVAINKIIH